MRAADAPCHLGAPGTGIGESPSVGDAGGGQACIVSAGELQEGAKADPRRGHGRRSFSPREDCRTGILPESRQTQCEDREYATPVQNKSPFLEAARIRGNSKSDANFRIVSSSPANCPADHKRALLPPLRRPGDRRRRGWPGRHRQCAGWRTRRHTGCGSAKLAPEKPEPGRAEHQNQGHAFVSRTFR